MHTSDGGKKRDKTERDRERLGGRRRGGVVVYTID